MNYKVVITAPQGSHGYQIFAADSFHRAIMDIVGRFVYAEMRNGFGGRIESLVPTAEPVTEGIVVMDWAPGESEELPDGVELLPGGGVRIS